MRYVDQQRQAAAFGGERRQVAALVEREMNKLAGGPEQCDGVGAAAPEKVQKLEHGAQIDRGFVAAAGSNRRDDHAPKRITVRLCGLLHRWSECVPSRIAFREVRVRGARRTQVGRPVLRGANSPSSRTVGSMLCGGG